MTSTAVVVREQRKQVDWGDKDSSSGYSDRDSTVPGEAKKEEWLVNRESRVARETRITVVLEDRSNRGARNTVQGQQ